MIQNRFRSLWINKLRKKWREYHWFIIGLVGFASFLSGLHGFKYLDPSPNFSWFDAFYCTLQLFVFEYSFVQLKEGLALNAARFLLPLVAGYTVVQALFALLHDHVQLFLLRYTRDHVIVCGVGEKGSRFVNHFVHQEYRVVVIERRTTHSMREEYGAQGVIWISGDATDYSLLDKAKVQKAQYLICVCGDDGDNAQIVVHARTLCKQRQGEPLLCLMHVVDPQLHNLMRGVEIEDKNIHGIRMQLFNLFMVGARNLWSRFPAFILSEVETGKYQPHLVIIGLGNLGQSLVVHAAQLWSNRLSDNVERLQITLVDQEVDSKKARLESQYPGLEQQCQFQTENLDVRSREFRRYRFIHEQERNPVSMLYICLEDDSTALSTGLQLHYDMDASRVPIVVCLTQDKGLAAFVNELEPSGKGFLYKLHVFGLLDSTCRPGLLLETTNETLARSIHEEYVRQEKSKGMSAQNNPALVSWEDLPIDIKRSNREQADDIGQKLRSIDCGYRPLAGWGISRFEFTPLEIECLARQEHERWLAERTAQGWKYAQCPKCYAKKTSPDLLPWEELSEASKEKDRCAIKSIPQILARAGFAVYRK